METPIRNVNVQ